MIEFLKQQFLHNQFFSAGLVVSIMGGIVFWLKSLPKDIFEQIKNRFIFTATIYQTDVLYDDFEAWFFSRYKNKYRNVEAVSRDSDYNRMPETIGAQPKPRKVLYKQIEGFFFVRYKGRLLHIKKGRDKLDHSNDIRSLFMNQYHISCFRGAKVINELLEECMLLNSKKEPNELKIYSHNAYGEWYVSGRITAKDIKNIVLPENIKSQILNDINEFTTSKDWYKNASIFYKRGHLYHGLPGNGKTSLSLAIASFMGRDLYCLDLNSINENINLKTAFNSISNNGFLLIEDIDGFYHLREAVKKDAKISFSTFLNCIDGAFYKEGLFTVITTNKINLVDPALMRKGRMDLLLEIPQPSIDEVNQYIQIFFGSDYLISEYENNYSMCDIQSICLNNKDNPEKALFELSYQTELNLTT